MCLQGRAEALFRGLWSFGEQAVGHTGAARTIQTLSEIALWQWRHATNQSDGMKPQGEQEELDDAPQTKCIGQNVHERNQELGGSIAGPLHEVGEANAGNAGEGHHGGEENPARPGRL